MDEVDELFDDIADLIGDDAANLVRDLIADRGFCLVQFLPLDA